MKTTKLGNDQFENKILFSRSLLNQPTCFNIKNSKTMSVSKTAAIYKSLQKTICQTLEDADGTGKFSEDAWEKEIGSGLTCVMQNGIDHRKIRR